MSIVDIDEITESRRQGEAKIHSHVKKLMNHNHMHFDAAMQMALRQAWEDTDRQLIIAEEALKQIVALYERPETGRRKTAAMIARSALRK